MLIVVHWFDVSILARDSRPHAAFGRLCLALASLCVRLGSCTDIIHGVVGTLGVQLPALPSLFQVLKHIPEEVWCHCVAVKSECDV